MLAIPHYTSVAKAAAGLSADCQQFTERVSGLTFISDNESFDAVVNRYWTELRAEGFEKQDVLDYIVIRASRVLDEIDSGG
jgi:hypothetical protein